MTTWMKKNFIIFLIITSIWSLVNAAQVKALETDTHETINKHIANNIFNGFSLDDYLKNQLGMQEGKNTFLNNKEVFKWLGDGGKTEDKPGLCMPYWRSRNHFHNPINNSGFSGIWDTGFLSGISVVEWALHPVNAQTCGYYSWNDARNYYYTALTAPDKATRETNFAETFRALGQVMHLVQDVSVPEHTRNNGHYFAYDYEKWIDVPVNRATINTSSSIPFTPNADYPLSVTNLFDTNRYNGTNPDLTLQNTIGLSEYANANFLSPDTIFKGFTYPAYSNMSERIVNKTLYLVKNGDEETDKYLARAQIFYKYLPPDYKKLALTTNDNEVHKYYAKNLIPRAIGYSSQILSYFFRAKMDMLPADPVTDGFVIKNETAETMEGEFHLYYDNTNDARVEIQSGDFPINAMTISGNSSSSKVNFDAPTDAKKSGEYMLVFRGKIGEEAGAVAARAVSIENPEYVIIIMNMGNSNRCFVWDVIKDKPAIIKDNSGSPATFPCDPANITTWVNSRKSIGKPLFEEALCGIKKLPLNASCNVYSSTESCSDEDSFDQPSNCGGAFRNTGIQNYNIFTGFKNEIITHEHYDTWQYPYSSQDMYAWWLNSNIKELSLKLSYLNQSSAAGVFRIERTVDRYSYKDTGEGVMWHGYGTTEERLSYHVPVADAIEFSHESNINYAWDESVNIGTRKEENVIRALTAQLYGEYSVKTIAQIYAFVIATGTRFADCSFNPIGFCVGKGCKNIYTCPWSPITYTVSGLKVAAQVGYFKDGTAGIDPTVLSRNSSFETIISDMYDDLREAENVPSDKLAGFGLSVQIK